MCLPVVCMVLVPVLLLLKFSRLRISLIVFSITIGKTKRVLLSERIGIFCDNTRDVIKGGCFDAREPGYVEGRPGSFWDIGGAVAAWCRSDKLPAHSPSQIVSYVSAHDNFTLWDKLMLVRYARPEYTAADSAALAQNRLAAGIYLTLSLIHI